MSASTREHDAVAAALESLPYEYRQVLVETHFRGRSAAEAARVLGLPVAVVKLRVYGALRELRRTLPVGRGAARRGPLDPMPA